MRGMELVSFRKSAGFSKQAEKLFAEQKARILAVLPDADIQHIGGTAIPNAFTKGDLDINVRVKKEDFETATAILKGMYEINQPDNWTPNYASFKEDTNLELPLGVQLTVIDSPDDVFVVQRDTLLNHPELVEKLNTLKMQYEGKSMEEYRKAKGELFKEIMS